MNYYGAKEMAAAFRTVRKNTLTVAEDIPEDQYGFRAAEGAQTVAELLVHIAMGARFHEQVIFVEQRTSMEGFDFMKLMGNIKAEAAKPRTKAEIVEFLKAEGEKFAITLEGLSDEFLSQHVSPPARANAPSKSRFEMLLGVKEHEMQHRGQLMLMERMLGITPHLTKENEARMAAMKAAMASKN